MERPIIAVIIQQIDKKITCLSSFVKGRISLLKIIICKALLRIAQEIDLQCFILLYFNKNFRHINLDENIMSTSTLVEMTM